MGAKAAPAGAGAERRTEMLGYIVYGDGPSRPALEERKLAGGRFLARPSIVAFEATGAKGPASYSTMQSVLPP